MKLLLVQLTLLVNQPIFPTLLQVMLRKVPQNVNLWDCWNTTFTGWIHIVKAEKYLKKMHFNIVYSQMVMLNQE